MEGDARGFRVALVAGELLNSTTGVDVLAVLQQEGWGAIQLPAADYPDDVAGPLLEQVAEQSEEFFRHGYRLAIVGSRAGLGEALARYRMLELPQIDPASEDELRTFLGALPAPSPVEAHGLLFGTKSAHVSRLAAGTLRTDVRHRGRDG